MKQFDYKLLKSFRAYAQMTQEEVASAAGISKSHVSECESGRKNMTVRTFVKIAAALGKEPNDFFIEKQ